MTFSPSTAAKRLAAILQRHGARVTAGASGLSSSRYLMVSGESEDLVRVRLSTHAQKPTYYRPAIEIGTHEEAATDSVARASAITLARVGLVPDAALARAVARHQAIADAACAARAATEKAAFARLVAQSEEAIRLDEILRARGHDRAVTGGKRWRELRAALRKVGDS